MPTAKTSTTKKSPARKTSSDTLSAEERAAVKDRAAELKAEGRRGSGSGKSAEKAAAKAAAEAQDVQDAIAAMEQPDRQLAERVHALVTAAGPSLTPRTWYGMPAYALDGNVLCFFQNSQKFKARYSTLGFNDPAQLDDGSMWPTAYALTTLTKADEAAITALIKKAVG